MENIYEEDEVFTDALKDIKLIEYTLISLYALNGILSHKTIRVIGHTLGRDMTILVKLGSTHNLSKLVWSVRGTYEFHWFLNSE